MPTTAIDLFLLDLPLVEPFAASHGTTTTRTVVAIRVVVDGVTGWGECSALPAATYTAESAAGCFALLANQILPELTNHPDRADAMAALRARFPAAPMALAGVEMALLDAELTGAGLTLARWLGADRTEVPAGVSLGLASPEAVVDRARTLVLDGYRRLKVKIQPGHDREVLAGLRSDAAITEVSNRAENGIEVQLDANGAYGADDLDLLVDLAMAGADALEQPLAPDHVGAAAELVERLAATRPVPVVADEAVTTLDDASELADRRAMTGISIKPARVGGLSVARDLHDLARERGLSATAGGMLETGLGRHALAAMAALPGFDLTGDLSPAGRWLADDPWPDLVMVDGRILVPDGPGVAPPPDLDLLDRYTVEHRTINHQTVEHRRIDPELPSPGQR